jgi:hypothetical protein
MHTLSQLAEYSGAGGASQSSGTSTTPRATCAGAGTARRVSAESASGTRSVRSSTTSRARAGAAQSARSSAIPSVSSARRAVTGRDGACLGGASTPPLYPRRCAGRVWRLPVYRVLSPYRPTSTPEIPGGARRGRKRYSCATSCWASRLRCQRQTTTSTPGCVAWPLRLDECMQD